MISMEFYNTTCTNERKIPHEYQKQKEMNRSV